MAVLSGRDPAAAHRWLEGYTSLCAEAETLGFSYAKITEHHLHQYGSYCSNPLLFLAAVAARTQSLRLMTGGLLPVFSHPVKVASETAMLDALSGGRLDVGYARAYLPREFDAFGVSMSTSRDRFNHIIAAVDELWTEPVASYKCDHFAFDEVSLFPRVTQAPRPPTWVAAARTPESFGWIGERGYGLLVNASGSAGDWDSVRRYREAFTPRADDPNARARVALSLPVVVRPTTQQARDTAREHLGQYLRTWAQAVEPWDYTSSSDYRLYSGMHEFVASLSPADLWSTGAAVVGSPQEATEQLAAIAAASGADVLLLQVDSGEMPVDGARTTLELLAEHTLPAVAA
jgi:alkanesulfonate monooxygenase SsuD/methylene tetrahydromethanopterin reductase-like flavin-dependent oxidoreductase (luciferase family)